MAWNREKDLNDLLPLIGVELIFKHQRILDAEFLKVANRQPDLTDREDAAIDEGAEFVAEFKTINKYWADKPTDLDKIIDEHSDIVHFAVGFYIASGETAEQFHHDLQRLYDSAISARFLAKIDFTDRFETIRFYLRKIRRSDDMMTILANATAVIGILGFNDYDVMNQYKNKRDENYKRIALTAEGKDDR